MTKEQIVTLPKRDLQAIVGAAVRIAASPPASGRARSTNPAGRSWLECRYPHDELAQRQRRGAVR